MKVPFLATDIFQSEAKRKERYAALMQEGKPKEAKEVLHRLNRGTYVADFVYGANDGIVTTFAVVAGATGALLSTEIIIILGVANLIADGFSMGASSFLSIRSEKGFISIQRKKEKWEVDNFPESEIQATEGILKNWGIPKESIALVARAISRNKEKWVDWLVREELELKEDERGGAISHGVATFGAFLAAGVIPLVPYMLGINVSSQFIVSLIVAGIAFFVVGAARTLVTDESAWKGGLEILLIGGFASGVAYFVGWFIKSIFGIIL